MASELDIAGFQTALKAKGFYGGEVDGTLNPATKQAMDAMFAQEATSGRLAPGWQGWTDPRRKLAMEQAIMRDAGIAVGEIDGLIGPATRFARDSYQNLLATGKPIIIPERDETPAKPIPATGKATIWPRQAECESFYGPVGTNQVLLTLPYVMRLSWDPSQRVRRFSCHAKVHDAFLRVFEQTLKTYGEDRIRELRLDLFGGCLNVRKMRGGTQMSMHSWGIAIDLDPENNALQMTKAKATFARPDYDDFWRIVESEGLVSLGRVRDFDWMHFQAARL
ncbi:M15 family metallopeptidase [Humitalea sp. 24SJ18S-53]|uniref:M15 family metallopeptidase n=1 Tax=Humitalea sp. 24SJ18S-53 TaxID=3422307 RepID=UPI003D6688F0